MAAHVLPLPLRVFGVLQGKVWKVRRFALGQGCVGFRHFAEKQRDRPTIRNNVMHRQDEEMSLRLQSDENRADQRSFP